MIAEFYCPSCRKWIERLCKDRQRILRERCENAGRIVKMRRRAVGKDGRHE